MAAPIVGEGNLPVIPTMVCLALAGVDGSNIDLAISQFGFLTFHGFGHGFVIPELRVCNEASLVMVLDPKHQRLKPLNLHRAEDYPSGSNWPSSQHRL